MDLTISVVRSGKGNVGFLISLLSLYDRCFLTSISYLPDYFRSRHDIPLSDIFNRIQDVFIGTFAPEGVKVVG